MIRFTKYSKNILKGLAVSAFFAATFVTFPATAYPLLNLSNIAHTEFNRVAFDLPKKESFELDFFKPKIIAGIEKKSNKTEFYQLLIHNPKTDAAERVSFAPNFTPAIKKTTSKLEFSSLNRFILSVTEQDRSEPQSFWYKNYEKMDFAGHDQPELLRSNLLNSPFANFLARKLTGPFNP